MCVCVCVTQRRRETKCVCTCVLPRGREGTDRLPEPVLMTHTPYSTFVSVSVLYTEKERERGTGKDKGKGYPCTRVSGRNRQRDGERERNKHSHVPWSTEAHGPGRRVEGNSKANGERKTSFLRVRREVDGYLFSAREREQETGDRERTRVRPRARQGKAENESRTLRAIRPLRISRDQVYIQAHAEREKTHRDIGTHGKASGPTHLYSRATCPGSMPLYALLGSLVIKCIGKSMGEG